MVETPEIVYSRCGCNQSSLVVAAGDQTVANSRCTGNSGR